MRREVIGLAGVAGLLALNTACTESLGTQGGILASSTRGVVINDAGTDANAGMDLGNTCFVDPKTGWMGTERDYPGTQDKVEDVGRHLGFDMILVTSDRGLHLGPVDPDSYELGSDLIIDGVVDAAIAEEDIGLVADQGGRCVVGWYGKNEGHDIDPSACAVGRLTIDPDLGDLFVATDDGVLHVPYEGSTAVVDTEADLAVYDGFTGYLYTALQGDTWVRATDPGGSVAWTTDLGLPVVWIDDLGWREGVAALVNADGVDQVWTIDAYTGAATLGDEAPGGATSLVASRNGRDFALVSDGQVAFREFARHERD